MSGRRSLKLSILFPSLLVATLSLLAQDGAAPRYPAQGNGPQNQAQGPADAGDQTPPPAAAGVARISLLNGDVSVRRGDSGDYVAAVQNAPVMVQDSIQTGAGARAEVQFDFANMIRLAQNTEVHFTDLQNGRFQMQLGRGTVTYRILRDTNAQVEIDTPSVSVRPVRQGVYRITVTDDGQTYVTPRSGQLEVFTPKGSQTIPPGQTMMARGPAGDPEFQMIQGLPRDEWDAWSDDRDRTFQQAWTSTRQYVPPDVYGTEELQGHGQWVNTPDYGGYAWYPQVGQDWSPYSAGRWVWEDYYGWTWVSYDPWGWAPYHYGRWFYRGGLGWGWWPGRIHERYFWSPALVGFFGFGRGIGVGFGFGSIGWVPLAPFERFHPWWGGAGFGRERFAMNVVNNTNINNVYRNARVTNGVMAMNSQQFGRTGTGYTHVSGSELRSASLVRGSLPVSPTSQSLHFTDRNTNTVARTNFSQSRFATHSPVPSVQRTSFAEQQRSMQTATQRAFGSSTGRSFGSAAGASASSNTFTRGSQTTGSTGSNSGNPAGWNRFGGTNNPAASQNPGARSFGSTPGARTISPSSPSSAQGGGWNRFGSTGSSGYSNPSYRSGGSQMSGSQQRGYSGSTSAPRYSAPNYSAPRYSAPSYSAPRYSAPAPHYSAPAQRSAPSSGGSRGSSSGGGHASGGGHRR